MSLDREYRPASHFTPAQNWMNDPNGLVWHKGEYHLFYQHNPYGTKWGHMSWGHAVSKDLLNWEHLPVAIAEEEDGMIFSGSAVSDGDDIVAIYTRHTETHQSQCIARSTDNGRTFVKYENNPVLDENKKDFRDPKVFRYQDYWIMCAAQPQDHQISFYESKDLICWKHLSDFGPAAAVDGVWECPDLFSLTFDGEEVWVLIVSLNPGGLYGSGTQYFIGDFDGTNFIARYSTEEPRWIDYGKDNYAGITFNNEPNGKRIFIGWMSNWSDVKDHPETTWTTQMTIPRELGLAKVKGEIVLTQQPLGKPTYEIKTLVPEKGSIGLEGFVRVGYDADKKVVFVNDYEAPYEPSGQLLNLKVLVDRSSVELFTGDGICSISLATFPTPRTSRELSPFGL
ncbi:SacC Beta-fructosidases (levanase/invertase) [Candidatus Nanopelagicaceae bacterium]